MELAYPWLLTVAGLLAAAGLWRLLRPARLRVPVAHRQVWQAALANVHRQRAWRMPQVWTVLLALGGVGLAGAVGGMIWTAKRESPPPVLVLIADTPQLAVGEGRKRFTEHSSLMGRLDELFARLDRGTPVRLVVVGPEVTSREFKAGDWPTVRKAGIRMTMFGPQPDAAVAERSYRHGEGMVYLLGEFQAVPSGRDDVQWIFRPQPPRDDLGIAAAGAVRNEKTAELFVRVQRLAGRGGPVRVLAWLDTQSLASEPLDLAGASTRSAVLKLPADFAGRIRIRLDREDDQPMNNTFYLAPQPAGARATFQVAGRPDERIVRACASGRLVQRQPSQPPADWLIVNEPTDPVAASPGQGVVQIDPLVLPAGVHQRGELLGVKMVAVAGASRWWRLPPTGTTIRRASHVELDAASPFKAIAEDESHRPLILVNESARQVVILFSVAAGNCDWAANESWPLFWDALADLGGTGSAGAGEVRWTWRAGDVPSLADDAGAEVATNLPPDRFVTQSPDRQAERTIRPPADVRGEAPFAVWVIVAVAAAALLLAGWVLSIRASRAAEDLLAA